MNEELKLQSFLNTLANNGNLKRLTTNFDNASEPVHRWFPFLAGFSNKLAGDTINHFNTEEDSGTIFDPFMGSGTTGVVGKEFGVKVIGNESNKFLYKICKVKTNLQVRPKSLSLSAEEILKKTKKKWKKTNIREENVLLQKCFPRNSLKKLVCLRDGLIESSDISNKDKDYLFMAITKCLPEVASIRINSPYVSWRHKRVPKKVIPTLKNNISMIKEDLSAVRHKYKNSTKIKVYLQDTRKENKKIKNRSVDLVFTSPPYLNNFDYGEALRVFLYYWKIAKNWGDITKKIRKQSVSSATTHYNKNQFIDKAPEEILGLRIIDKIPNTSLEIIDKVRAITLQTAQRKHKKSFDILTALYFKDMYLSLKEILRTMKNDSLAFFVVGDSAPYGIHVPTDTLLGEMGVELGFSSYTLQPIRERGLKWKTLKYRHKRKLRESLLILRK